MALCHHHHPLLSNAVGRDISYHSNLNENVKEKNWLKQLMALGQAQNVYNTHTHTQPSTSPFFGSGLFVFVR